MIKESTCFYEDIGKVVYRRKTGVKRLSIKIKANGEISVTIPFLSSFKIAENFVSSKSDWIKKTVHKLREEKPDTVVINDQSSFQTFSHTLRIIRYEGEKPRRRFGKEYIEVYIPFSSETESPANQEFIKNTLLETYRLEARIFLPERVRLLADIHGFRYKKVAVKNMKTRWGSCSGKNNINLNIHLMSVPEAFRDYVILHELVHTIEKNHGKMFWKKLEAVCPDSLNLRKALRKYSTDLRSC